MLKDTKRTMVSLLISCLIPQGFNFYGFLILKDTKRLNKETSIYGFCFLFYLFNLIRNFRQFMLLLAIIQLKWNQITKRQCKGFISLWRQSFNEFRIGCQEFVSTYLPLSRFKPLKDPGCVFSFLISRDSLIQRL